MAPYSVSTHSDHGPDDHSMGFPPKNSVTELGFSAPLFESISRFKSNIENWVQAEKSKADSRVDLFNKTLREQQSKIDSKFSELTHVQRERGMADATVETKGENESGTEDHQDNIASQKLSLQEKSKELEGDIMKLKTERDNREKRLQEVLLEESKQRLRASDAAALKQRVEESKKVTVDDLTLGVVNYKKLGFDFAPVGCAGMMRFTFTQLDPDDPNRKFAFNFFVNDEENYDIDGCDPAVDPKDIADILFELNSSPKEDMTIMARGMRRAFKKCL